MKHIAVSLEGAGLSIVIDSETGFLRQVSGGTPQRAVTAPGNATFTVSTGGSFSHVPDFTMNSEVRTGKAAAPAFRLSSSRCIDTGVMKTLMVEQTATEWELRTRYSLDRRLPFARIDLELEYRGAREISLDYVEISLPPFVLAHPASPEWADIRSSPVRVYRVDPRSLIAAWRFAEGDHSSIELRNDRLAFRLFMGGWMSQGTVFSGGGLSVAVLPDDGPGSLGVVKESLSRSSVTAHAGTPCWSRPANIYETFIGSWPMDGDGRSYSPYPTTQDLVRDLPRIRSLGFTILYLMPRHPFPSYSTASFTDFGLQWGDGPGTGASMQRLINAVHDQGMRILLDVILHGGLDASALAVQNERQRHFEAETTGTDARYDEKVPQGEMLRHWIVYERAHAPFWRQMAPDIHPFWEAHPEWFSKRKDGSCQYTYTRAFNLRHPGFQDFFASELLRCVQMGIDGFRFDAPFWTAEHYDWSSVLHRASWASGGCIEILARAHEVIAEQNRDVCFYVESMDASITRTAHLQYTYDTYWGVIDALGRRVVSSAVARQRLAFISRTRVEGIVDVNTVDSHDTCWWFRVGSKWARERYSAERARLLFALVSFLDGGVQLFSGGENGMEDLVTRLLRMRQELSLLRDGACSVESVACTSEHVIPIWRERDEDWLCAVLNFSDTEQSFELTLPKTAARLDEVQVQDLEDGAVSTLGARRGSTFALIQAPGAISIIRPRASAA